MNKKLFKGALVLFASILMAVSCSNNPATPEDPGKKPETPQEPAKNPIAVSLKEDDAVTKKLLEKNLNSSGADKNTTILEFVGASGAWESNKDSVTIALTGSDLGNVQNDYVFGIGDASEKTKRIKVTKVEGVVKSTYAQNDTLTALTKDLGASDGFTAITGDKAANHFTITGEQGGKIKIAPKNTLSEELKKGANGLGATDDGGVIKVTIEVSDVSNTKSPVELVIYFGVKRVKS